MTEAKTTGGCLCGAIRYDAAQAPIDAGYCHCGMCRRAMGGPFGAWVAFDRTKFAFATAPKWHASSAIAKRCFCSECGSPLAYQPDGAEEIYVWIGSLDDPENFHPRGHFHTEDRLSWCDIHAYLPDGPTTYEIDA